MGAERSGAGGSGRDLQVVKVADAVRVKEDEVAQLPLEIVLCGGGLLLAVDLRAARGGDGGVERGEGERAWGGSAVG